MFNLSPEMLEKLCPGGKLTVDVEPRVARALLDVGRLYRKFDPNAIQMLPADAVALLVWGVRRGLFDHLPDREPAPVQ